MQILVLSPTYGNKISGIQNVIGNINQELLRLGCTVKYVTPYLGNRGVGLSKPLEFQPVHQSDRLRMLHWSDHFFQDANRHWLVHEIEKELHRSHIDCVIAYDIHRVGYAASLACYLSKIPFFAFATWGDAFVHHMSNAQEVSAVAQHAKAIFSCSPMVLNHLEAFHKIRGVFLKPEIDSADAIAVYKTAQQHNDHVTQALKAYVVTSGHIDEQTDYYELVQRVSRICTASAMTWCHLGSVDHKIVVSFNACLVSSGMADKFAATGLLSSSEYFAKLAGASVYVKAFGGEDTNQSLFEALSLSMELSLPEGHWFYDYAKDNQITCHYHTMQSVAELADTIVHSCQ